MEISGSLQVHVALPPGMIQTEVTDVNVINISYHV